MEAVPSVAYFTSMNLLILLVALLLLFGSGGFYFGGPMVGGGLLGFILLIALIVYIIGVQKARQAAPLEGFGKGVAGVKRESGKPGLYPGLGDCSKARQSL
jgi:hypothetical protein